MYIPTITPTHTARNRGVERQGMVDIEGLLRPTGGTGMAEP